MQVFEAYLALLQFLCYEACHSLPLAEYDDFLAFCLYQGGDDVQRFVYLRVIARFLVEDIRAVAEHAHLRETEQQSVSVFL